MSDMLILDLGAEIKGNCTYEGYKDKVIVQSFSHGMAHPQAGEKGATQRSSGRPSFSEMTFSKQFDLATTEMYKLCAKGDDVPTAKFFVGRIESGKFVPYITYEFTNATISQISTSGGGGVPSDSFCLDFAKIKVDYNQQGIDAAAKGTATWNWDLTAVKAT